jgi:hypothetical protein
MPANRKPRRPDFRFQIPDFRREMGDGRWEMEDGISQAWSFELGIWILLGAYPLI